MRIRIEAARPQDVAEAAALAAETFPMACPPHLPTAAIAAFVAEKLSPAAFERFIEDVHTDVLLAWEGTPDGGMLWGYALLVDTDPPQPIAALLPAGRAAELSKIYVREAAQGTGAASALLAAAVDVAHARGAHAVWLGTNERNLRAQRFYEREGFERVGSRRFLVGGQWEDDAVYACALRS